MVLKKRFTVGLILCFLAAMVLVSCGSGGEVQWTIHTEMSSPGSGTVRQKFFWDPIHNVLVGQENDVAVADSVEEMREAGYSTHPEGYILSEETEVYYSQGAVEQIITFRFDGDFSESPEGEMFSQMWIDGEPQNLYSGDFYITTDLDDQGIREFLNENSPAFLLAESFKNISAGRYDEASDELNTLIDLNPEHIAAWETKTGLLLSNGEKDKALSVISDTLDEDSDNLSALEQKFRVLRLMQEYNLAFDVRKELLEKQRKAEEELVIPVYASRRVNQYYVEEYYLLEGYIDLLELALLSGDNETAKKYLTLAEDDFNKNSETYNMIYDEAARSFSVPYYRISEIYELVKKLDVYQIFFCESEGDQEGREEYLFYLDGLVIRDFASELGLRPTDEFSKHFWLPDSVSKDEMEPGSEWEVGKMVRRPEELLIDLAGNKRHPETIRAIAQFLPMVAYSDDPDWEFAGRWKSQIETEVADLNHDFIDIIKKYTGYSEEKDSEEFNRKLESGDVGFIIDNIIDREHFLREFDHSLDITIPGDDFMRMNNFYLDVLLILGDKETGRTFGLYKYFSAGIPVDTIIHMLSEQAMNWGYVKENLDLLLEDNNPTDLLYFLEYYLYNPPYAEQSGNIRRAYGYVQMHLYDV